MVGIRTIRIALAMNKAISNVPDIY